MRGIGISGPCEMRKMGAIPYLNQHVDPLPGR